jgi:chemotaxis protein CheY-P-specific phosphatase CheC
MSKYSPKNLLNKEPVVLAAAVVVVLNTLSLLGVVTVSVDQLSAINAAVVTVLALFTRQSVTPNQKVVFTKADVKALVDNLLYGDGTDDVEESE